MAAPLNSESNQSQKRGPSIKKYYDHEVGDFLSVLHYFCRRGGRNIDDIRTVIDLHPQLVSQVTPNGGDTPLHFAVASNDLEVTKVLLEAGPSTAMIKSSKNGFFGDQFTPLHVAIVSQSSPEIIEALVRACPKIVRIRTGQKISVPELAFKYYKNGNDLGTCLNIISSLRRTTSIGKAMSDSYIQLPSRSNLKKQNSYTTPQA